MSGFINTEQLICNKLVISVLIIMAFQYTIELYSVYD